MPQRGTHYTKVIGKPVFTIPHLGYVADYVQHHKDIHCGAVQPYSYYWLIRLFAGIKKKRKGSARLISAPSFAKDRMLLTVTRRSRQESLSTLIMRAMPQGSLYKGFHFKENYVPKKKSLLLTLCVYCLLLLCVRNLGSTPKISAKHLTVVRSTSN